VALHCKRTVSTEGLRALYALHCVGYRHLSTESRSTIYNHCIKKSFIFFLYLLISE
jgi:hypothetical protein